MNQNAETPEKEDIDRLVSRFEVSILKRYSRLKVAIINGDEKNQVAYFKELVKSLQDCAPPGQ